jgi:hypothetical protein
VSFLQPPDQPPVPDPAQAPPEATGDAPTHEGEFVTTGAPTLPPELAREGGGITTPAGATAEDIQRILSGFIEEQKKWRAQVIQDVRHEAARLAPAPAAALTPQEQLDARLKELAAHPYYCPICGHTHDYLRECTGSREAPHPPFVVVATKEVLNPPDPRDREAFADYQAQHTPAPSHEELLARP